MTNSVVHFEIPADDFERAQKFYTDAFGWQLQHMPELQYTMVMTTESDEQGMPKTPGSINGGMGKRQSPTSEHPTVTIGVEDIDKAFEAISGRRRFGARREDAGGRHGLGGILQRL